MKVLIPIHYFDYTCVSYSEFQIISRYIKIHHYFDQDNNRKICRNNFACIGYAFRFFNG